LFVLKKKMRASSFSHRTTKSMSFAYKEQQPVVDCGESACAPKDYSITLMFMAHAGVNQADLWNRWYLSAARKDRDRIHVVWWMDHRSDESLSPVQVTAPAPMFTADNRYKSATSTFRYHHTQASIELELLKYAHERHPNSHHYHLVSGACIPIKPPARFLRVLDAMQWRTFLDPSQSHLPLFHHEPMVWKHARKLQERQGWMEEKLAVNHFQFWILNNDHTRRILTLAQECLPFLVAVQKSMFADGMKGTGLVYDNLTKPDKMSENEYDISIPSPPEWFFSALLLEALKRTHHTRNIPELISASINQTCGVWQDHATHGVDHHPIEFESMDGVVVLRHEPTRLETSLRKVLTENTIASSDVVDGNLALWRDVNTHVVRKVGRKPFTENTWFE
jgi:hypothetical protein